MKHASECLVHKSKSMLWLCRVWDMRFRFSQMHFFLSRSQYLELKMRWVRCMLCMRRVWFTIYPHININTKRTKHTIYVTDIILFFLLLKKSLYCSQRVVLCWVCVVWLYRILCCSLCVFHFSHSSFSFFFLFFSLVVLFGSFVFSFMFYFFVVVILHFDRIFSNKFNASKTVPSYFSGHQRNEKGDDVRQIDPNKNNNKKQYQWNLIWFY